MDTPIDLFCSRRGRGSAAPDAPLQVRRKQTDSSLVCPACGEPRVACIDSRITEHNVVRRRRACGACGRRWTTYEVDADTLDRTQYVAGLRAALTEIATHLVALADTLPGREDDPA